MLAEAECYLCHLSQVLRVLAIQNIDGSDALRLTRESCRFLAEIDFERTPPEISADLYKWLAEKTGIVDPYFETKRRDIRRALALYPRLKNKVLEAPDRLRTALLFSLAGNIIDFGAGEVGDWPVEGDFLEKEELDIDDYELFTSDLKRATRIVFLGDNAGETVFDRLFIEQIGRQVIYVVREGPIINDATVEEARLSGLEEVARVVSSGCQAPGTVLEQCSQEFIAILKQADLIISKGQGNYECLEQLTGPFYFLLKAKCEVISRHLNVNQGSLVLARSKNYNSILNL
ncbi:MAG TPA: ARMT1-like domain-containing protein [Candidatus Saccharicenans sp.]|nr:ARMT1-like domain-containing protein [Candidatus Saccharicenans sp.]HQO76691.1 ARMT1-like domain-containing protein [Candidatus Saccharicenans sp.]